MATIGFTNYEAPPAEPTLQELIAALTAGQKTTVLDSFATGKGVVEVKDAAGIPTSVVIRLYAEIKRIEDTSRLLMRGEYITGYDGDGNPQYASAPTDAAELLAAVEDEFVATFTSSQVEAILTKMVQYSKGDGTGTWTFYSTEVVK